MDQIGYKDMRLRNGDMTTLKNEINEIERTQGRHR